MMFLKSWKLKLLNHLQIRRGSSLEKATPPPCPITKKPCIPDMCALDPDCPQPKVVIVGAGIAGLSAAQRLISCGLKKIVVLEAQDRPGGRIYTKKVGDMAVDLGASWIDGACPGNPAFSLACQDGALQSPMVRASRYDNNSCFDSKGQFIRPRVYHAAHRLFQDIKFVARRKYNNAPEDLDLWTFFEKQIQEVVPLFPTPEQNAAELVLYSLTNEVRHSLGTPLESIPLPRYGRMKIYPGGVVSVQSGMQRILNPLLQVISEKRIKYKKMVTRIDWILTTPDVPRVTVHTQDGGREDADYVIVAVPLGVLKLASEKMFNPPLPVEKMEAIKALGVGNISNIVMKYAKPFWIKGEGYIRICWSKEELERRSHWTTSMHLIEENPVTNDTLHTTVSGPEAVEVERMSDCELAKDLTGLLRRFVGNKTIPMPSDVFRANWKNNMFIGGTTMFLSKGTYEKDIAKLARPIPELGGLHKAPAVLFAGEACSIRQGGLPAARLSGIAEAERILRFTKCFWGPPPPPSRVTMNC